MQRKDGRPIQNDKNQIKSIKIKTEEIQSGNLPESEKMSWNYYLFFKIKNLKTGSQI